jgi:transcriptional regulator with XRE-family HTH domain
MAAQASTRGGDHWPWRARRTQRRGFWRTGWTTCSGSSIPGTAGPLRLLRSPRRSTRPPGKKVISSTYVWQLRTGRRDNPTQKHLSALAAFFGVSPMYFFDEAEASRDAIPPELIAALKDGEVREMTLRAAGLSGRSLQAIRDMIESARAVEGMPAADRRARPGGNP